MSSDRSNSERTLPQTTEELRRAQERSLQPSRPPMVVPGYHAERFIGAGAYGQVWVAVDGNTGRRVAIKFYNHRGGLDWSLLSREVERLALLFADRYVVQLLDVGWDADPPYYVMEYLGHGSLADRLEQGPMPAEETIELFREVAIGLVHAHGKGILHCDLKPANVLLDQDGKPRLADFGQSRLSTEQSPSLGTLFYMAPEQADLEAMPDARWDVYALGALLHCMLTGEPPFRDARAMAHIQEATGLEEQLARYREFIREAPRPQLHRQVPGVDRELGEIVNRCLAVDPHRRFPNPQAVLDALHARSARRDRRPLLILGAVGPAVLLVVAALFLWDVLETAVDESSQALTRRALESDRFAAQFVAETVGAEIDRRWQILEQVAAQAEFRRSLAAAAGKPRESAERQALQTLLAQADGANPIVDSDNWFLMDAQGRQVGHSPPNERTIDRDFAYRDYFHGQGRDLPHGNGDVPPIRAPHLSIVFKSAGTGERAVALSVPVWSHDEGGPDRTVIGVLGHSVGLGHFAELHPDERSGNDQLAVLVDGKPDWTGRPGAILEHPRLAEALKQPAEEHSDTYLTPDDLNDLEQLRAMRRKLRAARGNTPISADDVRRANELAWLQDYDDPLAHDPNQRWLAAIEPVVVHVRLPEPSADTGWAIIVQERYAAAVTPVQQLRDSLLWRSVLAVAVLLFVVTGLWGFVVVVLNESHRFRWLRRARRRLSPVSNQSSGTEYSHGFSPATSVEPSARKTESNDRAPTPD